jgi:hypothetical protein
MSYPASWVSAHLLGVLERGESGLTPGPGRIAIPPPAGNVGSGKLGAPWARMPSEDFTAAAFWAALTGGRGCAALNCFMQVLSAD